MPSNLVTLPLPFPEHIRQRTGTVVDVLTDGTLLVERDGVRLRCKRAFSCLIDPIVGDCVTLSFADTAQIFVLAILERSVRKAARIGVDGELVVEATDALRFVSNGRVHVQGRDALKLESGQMEFSAELASIAVGDAQLHASRLRVLGQALESVFERIVQISKKTFRTVESVDHLRAGHIDYSASESVRLHGRHAVLTAERLSKIDAEQIHLG
ncbi:DUF3540 domain-containing protein [Caballeronia ptereochthonis]|uniref:Lipoprotein n=1 Tax=Caballeronia ptereochthonis TaxID=1777144 RepID=A0A158A8P9_9BURK|nr:DUF3540 domain-containing protein [Caballeronia ptereochthonis]SAK54242.1 putative lipoprotein [Caballeronia ptereochthonis]